MVLLAEVRDEGVTFDCKALAGFFSAAGDAGGAAATGGGVWLGLTLLAASLAATVVVEAEAALGAFDGAVRFEVRFEAALMSEDFGVGGASLSVSLAWLLTAAAA